MTQRDRIIECNERLKVLYQWYNEKSTKGWHKEFSFEWLKQQIAKWEHFLDDAEHNWNSQIESAT